MPMTRRTVTRRTVTRRTVTRRTVTRRSLLSGLALGPVAFQFGFAYAGEAFAVTHSEAEWRKKLTPDQFAVLRQDGTEPAFTSALLNEHRHGTFACAGCDLALYASDTKFDSGTGWPSFWQPLDQATATHDDAAHGLQRTEVHCSRCGGHLGHVFTDGPKPTGLRYCMNGVALTFHPMA